MASFNLVNQLKLNNSFFTIDLNPHLLTPTQEEEEEDEDMEDSFFDLNIFSDSNSHNHRKVLPIIQPISKPQSASSFSSFIFKKQKSMAAQEMEERALKYPSKRFSKEAMNKYLKLIKPLYSKVSKIYSEKNRSFQTPSPAIKHFGKSKSASAATGRSLRRDDPLSLHVDGIQSAILHCKRSYEASRDSTSSSSSFCSDYHSVEETHPRASSSSTDLYCTGTIMAELKQNLYCFL